ncbi:MAG TPA: hypothetical protein PKY96_06980, partial [Flavobacteriales bacterium]|nr:hypothetical protein [Flavobacteriales bacterium]
LGVNLSDWQSGPWDSMDTYRMKRRYFDEMLNALPTLNSVGGNFARTFLMRNAFAPEWGNLGVYDKYLAHDACGNILTYRNSCQNQAWAFDRIMEEASAQGIYLQVWIDPYPPIIDMQYNWYGHSYLLHFVEPTRDPVSQRFDMKQFFFTPNAPLDEPENVFYWWKRKYKYIMNRWGWSAKLAIIEPFNEIDQLLTYSDVDLTPPSGASVCPNNKINWIKDDQLRGTVNDWFTQIAQFVRGEQNLQEPAHSPLAESKKLFLASYTSGRDAFDWSTGEPNVPPYSDYLLPFTNTEVDLIDVHMGLYPNLQGPDNDTAPEKADRYLKASVDRTNEFWQTFPSPSASLNERKPFNHGEFNHYTHFTVPNPIPNLPPVWSNDVEKIFHNYDVSFHNELWASAFSGKFAAGTSWHRERVFWWNGTLAMPPTDGANTFQHSQTQQFSNSVGDVNGLLVNGQTKLVRNNRLLHHFRPLSDFLNRPSIADLGVLSGDFTPAFFYDDAPVYPNPIECYYLRNDQSTAIGWVHNRNASVAKSFYVKSGTSNENFLGCTAPANDSITLTGFFPLHAHYITWFPTRIGAADLPPDTEFPDVLMSTSSGEITIVLSGHFNGTEDSYLDTLHSDYAFVITHQPFVKNLQQVDEPETPEDSWDFLAYPNPTRGVLMLRFLMMRPRTSRYSTLLADG